jgi:hypothetical protein
LETENTKLKIVDHGAELSLKSTPEIWLYLEETNLALKTSFRKRIVVFLIEARLERKVTVFAHSAQNPDLR